jgi:hypothetical protein
MEHKVVEIKSDFNGIPKGTKGTIVFEYSVGVYEVEFMVNGKTVTETLTDEDLIIL